MRMLRRRGEAYGLLGQSVLGKRRRAAHEVFSAGLNNARLAIVRAAKAIFNKTARNLRRLMRLRFFLFFSCVYVNNSNFFVNTISNTVMQ